MVSKDFNIKSLRAIPLFSSLPDERLEELRPALKVMKVGAGEAVVREGDSATRLYVLVKGEVQVVKNYLEPGAQTVDVMKSGSFFGEMALMAEDSVRSASVVTSEECNFLALERDAFKQFVERNPDVAYLLLKEAFRRLRQANELIASLQKDRPE
jgi:CRP-like cAMP-binding protein